jgi:hypothetical protein
MEVTVFVGIFPIYPQDIINYYGKCGLRQKTQARTSRTFLARTEGTATMPKKFQSDDDF